MKSKDQLTKLNGEQIAIGSRIQDLKESNSKYKDAQIAMLRERQINIQLEIDKLIGEI